MERVVRYPTKRYGRRITRYVFFVLAFAAIIATGSETAAQQSGFIVTPPPIASSAFVKDQKDLKVRGTILTIKGSNNSSLSGAGGDVVFRKAFSDFFAGNLQGGLFFIGGDMTATSAGTTTKTTMLNENILFSANVEFQPYKGDAMNVIFYGGPLVNLLLGNMDFKTTTGGLTTTSNGIMSGALTGLQAGIHVGIKAGDFHIDPFAAASTQSGRVTVSAGSGDVTSDIRPFTTTSLGLGIVYTPWDFTLSSILQKAADQKTNGTTNPGYDVTIIQFGWHKQF